MRSAALRRSAAVAAAIGIAVSACGQDVEVSPAPPKLPTPKTAPPAGGTVQRDPLRTPAATTQRMRIVVDDSGAGNVRYTAPRTVRGGLVEITLRNDGAAPHKAQLWRVEGDHTVEQALRIRHPQPDWLRTAGGVSLTRPGATSRSLQALPAGSYYVAENLGSPGTVARFEVTAPARDVEVPKAPARVEALDFSFKVSGLRAGSNTIDFDNTGRQPHHAFFAPLRDGADIADVRKFFSERTSTGPPPVDSEGTRETVVIEGGDRQVTQLNLTAGRYALICFVQNREGSPQHIEFGMINEVRVRRRAGAR
jgi:hypothetical protein